MATVTIMIGKATVIVDSVEAAADLLQRVGVASPQATPARPARCVCPNTWSGILPPTCPVHNPPPVRVASTSKPSRCSMGTKLVERYKWHEVLPPKTWHPAAVGEELVGFYGGRTVRSSNRHGQYDAVLIRTVKGLFEQTYTVSGTVILQLIDAAGLAVGDPVRIIWRGYKSSTSSGREYKTYGVLVPAKEEDDEGEACGSEKTIQ